MFSTLPLHLPMETAERKSCELLAAAVSDLCFGIRLDGYLAMNVSSIPLLNDEVGGVTVTIEEDGLEVKDPLLKKWECRTPKRQSGRIICTLPRYYEAADGSEQNGQAAAVYTGLL